MQLTQSFDVAAPVDRVWAALIDVEHVAPCLPGAAISGRGDDGSYRGTFTVKIGPASASYSGRLEMAELDESEHRATLLANGTDKRGQGGANATIVSRLSESPAGGTHVEVQADYRITGRLAGFGRGGMIEDISEKLLTQFAERLAQSLAPAPATSDAGAMAAEAGAGPAGNGALHAEAPAARFTAPAQEPDVGRLAAAALLARVARNWWQLLVGTAAVVVLLRGLRGLRRLG
jgi:carbon monoxide dehydrogenase subunit G